MAYLANDMGQKNEEQTAGAVSLTESAIIVHQIINDSFKNVKEGTSLNLRGTSDAQVQKINDKLAEKGFQLKGQIVNFGTEDEPAIEYRYIVTKQESADN